MLLRNGVAAVDVIHACRRAGIADAPINGHFTASEATTVLQDSGAKLLIADADLLAALGDAFAAGLPVRAVGSGDDRDDERWLAAQPLYSGPEVAPRGHMAFTSGTSGRPKGVLRQPVPLAEQAALARAAASPALAAFADGQGHLLVTARSDAEIAAFLARDRSGWEKTIRERGIALEN